MRFIEKPCIDLRFYIYNLFTYKVRNSKRYKTLLSLIKFVVFLMIPIRIKFKILLNYMFVCLIVFEKIKSYFNFFLAEICYYQ